MAYTYNVTTDLKCEVILDGTVVDTVGPWGDAEGPTIWGAAVCDKYNSAEYADTPYPQQLKPAEPAPAE